MKYSLSTIQLKALFGEKLLLYSQPGAFRWIVARSSQRELILPQGVEMQPRIMHSRAISHRAPRQYRNARLVAKSWPDDHLTALRVPKLLCVTSGSAVIELGEYELEMPEGTFLFIPPGVPQPDGALSHIRELQSSQECDVSWMSPRGEQLHFWQCHSAGSKHFSQAWSNVFFQSRKITQYFALLGDEAVRAENATSPIVPHLLALLLLEMNREIESERFLRISHMEDTVGRFTPSRSPVSAATQYLDANFEESITIESLAHRVGMSRSQLALRFREQTGCTVIEYLTEKRLEAACKLLRETEWTLTYIVSMIGFRSLAHFHTLFRKKFGCSPMEFRRLHSSIQDDTEPIDMIQNG